MNIWRSMGMFLLLTYVSGTMINILYVYADFSTTSILLALAAIYVVNRVVKFFGKNGGVIQSEMFGFALVLLLSSVLVLQKINHQPFVDVDGTEVVGNLYTLATVCITWFFIGGACNSFRVPQSDYLAVLIASSVAALMFFATDESLTIPYNVIASESGAEGVSHLVLEKHIVIPLIFAYALSNKTKYIVVGLALLALFFMGGRTALFVFFLVSVLLAVRGNLFLNVVSICLLSLLAAVLFQYGVQTGYIDINDQAIREILFLDGVTEDGSFQSRTEIYNITLPLLADQIWIGNHSLVVEQTGEFSGYMHNLLSAWQFYGAFVFIAIAASLFYCIRRMIIFSKHSVEPADVFGAFLLIYVIISVILSKYTAWHMLWFALGYWMLKESTSSITSRKKRRRKKRKRRMRKIEEQYV